MTYRKHSVSKGARRAHHKREKARRKALLAKGGQIDPFGYVDTRGCDRKRMRILSITKGARDGAPRLVPKNGQEHPKFGQDAIAMETRQGQDGETWLGGDSHDSAAIAQ